jgi:hypothetical protein
MHRYTCILGYQIFLASFLPRVVAELERLDISDSPELKSFTFQSDSLRSLSVFRCIRLKYTSFLSLQTPSLTELDVRGMPIDSDALIELLAHFPKLEIVHATSDLVHLDAVRLARPDIKLLS